jgi:hypothetical protein
VVLGKSSVVRILHVDKSNFPDPIPTPLVLSLSKDARATAER